MTNAFRTQQSRDGFSSLAKATGLPINTILGLAERDELRSLFNDAGRLETRAAPKSALEAKRRLVELLERRANW